MPDTHILGLALSRREVGRGPAREEALPLLLNVRGVDGGVRRRGDVHHDRVLLTRVLLLDGVDTILRCQNTALVRREEARKKAR